MKKCKTYKREVASLLVAVLIGLAIFAMMGTTPEMVNARAAVLSMVALPFLTFAAAAFGMDWVAKQTEWAGPSTRKLTVSEAPNDYPADIVAPEQKTWES